MEKKVALAIELERATRAADPRVRQVSSADYSDSRVEVALASTTGISPRGGARTRSCPSTPSPARARRPRPVPGSASAGAGRARARRGDGRRRRAGHPHARARRRCARHTAPWSSTSAWSRRCSLWWGRPSRVRPSSRAGRSSPGGSGSLWPPPPSRWSTTRPTPGPTAPRPTTARAWPAGATSSSPTACCACSCTTRSRPAVPGRSRPGRRPGRLRRHSLGWVPRPRAGAGGQGARRDPGLGRRRPLRPVGYGHPLGGQPRER
jgi:hypothetical protein